MAVLKENAFKDKGKIEQIIGVLKKDWSIFKGPFTDYMQLLEIYNGLSDNQAHLNYAYLVKEVLDAYGGTTRLSIVRENLSILTKGVILTDICYPCITASEVHIMKTEELFWKEAEEMEKEYESSLKVKAESIINSSEIL